MANVCGKGRGACRRSGKGSPYSTYPAIGFRAFEHQRGLLNPSEAAAGVQVSEQIHLLHNVGSVPFEHVHTMAVRITVSRRFVSETGFTFTEWRQRVRLLKALELLAGGKPVTAVALDLGYGNVSAFIALFRRVFGVTPGRYQSTR